jgi:hypothetical protein
MCQQSSFKARSTSAVGPCKYNDVRLLRRCAKWTEVNGLKITELVDRDFLNKHPHLIEAEN